MFLKVLKKSLMNIEMYYNFLPAQARINPSMYAATRPRLDNYINS